MSLKQNSDLFMCDYNHDQNYNKKILEHDWLSPV